ncbi:MAG TPA: phage exclusion protein Lit family protein [Terriglobales bacterium]|jgi:hypothetical protein|nr:phage exclusion protein Lit family protein [Terriglobales bacterium]
MLHGIASFSSIFFIISILVLPLPPQAENNYYLSWGRRKISYLRDEIHTSMTPEQVKLEKLITYVIVDKELFNAISDAPQGKREVKIYWGVFEGIDYLSTMNTVALLWDRPQCLIKYGDYLHRIYESNAVSVSNNLRENPIEPPFVFMKSNADICPQVSPEVVLNNEQKSAAVRTVLILQSIKWVLLHEFAHHLYNDFDAVDPAISRQREERADAYATQTMLVSPDDNPMSAIPVLILFCSVEDFNLYDKRQDHPTGLKRVKTMFETARKSDKWKNMWDTASPSQRTQIQAMMDHLKEIE